MTVESPAAGDWVVAPERGGAIILAVSLACFGFALGFTTAISRHAGISGQLLSGLFSFVGGSVLTYGGFRYVRRAIGAASVQLSPTRVGLGLLGLSLGVLCGEAAGVTYSSSMGIRIAERDLEACIARAKRAAQDDPALRTPAMQSCLGLSQQGEKKSEVRVAVPPSAGNGGVINSPETSGEAKVLTRRQRCEELKERVKSGLSKDDEGALAKVVRRFMEGEGICDVFPDR